MAIGSSVLNFVFDETMPELTSLGQTENINLSSTAKLVLNPVDNVVQSLTWLTGVLYMIMLIGSVGIVFIVRGSPSKWLLGLYFGLAIILILGAMLMSNMYEEFYDSTDDLALRMKEHTLLSNMLLYSPAILTVIVFITGIILFSGLGTEQEII